MQELCDLANRCATAAATAEPNDLPSLAQLHTDLLALRLLMLGGGGSFGKGRIPPSLAGTAERAAQMVERLVLREVDDTTAAIDDLRKQVDEVNSVITQATSSSPTAATPTPAAPAIIEGEKVIAEGDAPMAIEFVGEAIGHLDAAEASLLKLEEDPADSDEVNAVFRAFHTIKGVAGFLELKQIGALAHAAEALLDQARKGKIRLVGRRHELVLEARDLLRRMVEAVDVAAKTLRAPVLQDGLDGLIQRLGAATRRDEISTATAPVKAVASSKPTPPVEGTAAKATNPVSPTATSAGGDGVVKVATGRLDALINTVGELVIAQAMVSQNFSAGMSVGDPKLARNLSQMGKITRSLQDLSMSMRMVPIAGVFQKMARLARDVGRKAGKDVEFVPLGGDTELDRNVVEAISDPLVHMVRNSIDHGMETPEERVKIGKPRAGRLVLKACHSAGSVVIQITDDGRGLNKEKLVQKAIAAGVVKEGQELTDQQIFQLVFLPGLSTAEKVTDISGRGVGMDVVRKNVEALRGRIEIASTPGKGSTFTLRLPLTLAVIDGLIVKVGAERYIIPITSIEQSLRPTARQISTVQNQGELCMMRDKLLPMVRLHKLFKVTPKTEDPTEALLVIVQEGTNRCCLLVDELVGQHQVVIKSVGKEIGDLPGFAGCAILGDGNVSLILDVAGIIHSALR